ncbi:MAG: DEAD/DEAH box helicase [Oscillospiraceae bacterium]|nr:DEAD/DEAH box helicase [Oscillospiraceae bacterium]
MNSIDPLVRAIDPPLPGDAEAGLEVTLHLGAQDGKPQLHAALRAGLERLYVVRNLPQFLRSLAVGEPVSFGRTTLEQDSLRWPRRAALIVNLLQEIETARAGGQPPPEGESRSHKFIAIPSAAAPRLFRLLCAQPFQLALRGDVIRINGVERAPLPLRFDVNAPNGEWRLTARIAPDAAALTPDASFVYSAGRVHSLDSLQAPIVRALLAARVKDSIDPGRIAFALPGERLEPLVAELFPTLEAAGALSIAPELERRIERGAMTAAVYLDRENATVLARVEFRYGERAIDPFAPASGGGESRSLLMRDARSERGVLEELSRAGFRVRAGHAYLENAQQTLAFFLDGVTRLNNIAEVYCSDRFQRMKPRRPSLSGRLTAKGSFIQFILAQDGEPAQDAMELLSALRDRRRYFRLRDGAFLDLEGLDRWQPLARELADSLTDGAAWLGASEPSVVETASYRAPDWIALLDGQPGLVQLDESMSAAAAAFDAGDAPPPASLNATLRPYQRDGHSWLLARYNLKMGGVLADDMGLGKTIQMIAAIQAVKDSEGRALSMVVAPTTLLYNWLAEVKRFAPELNAAVMEGGPIQRKKMWRELADGCDMDLIITSYPLLRRDVEDMEPLPFRMIILDEAQQIKNARACSAMMIKRLNADARFALTGTPMENHPGELWSIFDFVLPGYLLSQNQFMSRHGAGQDAETLRRKIRPFLLRRLKRDVLPDLPAKTEQIVWVEMTPEQKKVYQASTQRAREKADRMLASRGFASSRFEILSLIMELRQVCCHPSLRFEGYEGSSGKIDALADLLPGALDSGRRILIFSQFTRMLRMLESRFAQMGFDCLYLDGHTPTRERLAMADRFNAGEGQLFLISLKAGGAGLNLVGADMVVHYDPWWNPAAEDQATDRAHRIGQTRAVQALRLITRGTIEERVDALSRKKRALYDAIIPSQQNAGVKFDASKLTEADIRELLECDRSA